MPEPYINHVALPVDNVDTASAFYVDWFNAKVIPSPKFPVPVAWLMLGKIQVHLVEHASDSSNSEHRVGSTAYHFAVAIDDRAGFEALYERAAREGTFDTITFPHHIYELPGGDVQLWIRDTSGNVIEVDYPNVSDLSAHIAEATRRWVEDGELTDWNRQASLFRPEQSGIATEGRLAGASNPAEAAAVAGQAVSA